MVNYQRICEAIAFTISNHTGYAVDGNPADHALPFVEQLIHELERKERESREATVREGGG